MRKPILRTLFFLTLGFLILDLIGCAALSAYGRLERSARQSYQRGDYDTAVYECAEALRINPQYEKAQILIQDAFRAATLSHENALDRLMDSSNRFRWDSMVREYEALVSLNGTVAELPTLTVEETGSVIEWELEDYSGELENAKQSAAEVHYQEGIRLSGLEGIENKRQSAKEFKKSMRYTPGYKDAALRYEEVREEAVIRMAVIPFEDKSGKRWKYGAVSETIADGAITDIMEDPGAMEFLDIVSRDQLNQVMAEQELTQTGLTDQRTAVHVGKLLGVQQIVTGKITQIIYTPDRTVKSTTEETKRLKAGTETYTDEEGEEKERAVYETVSATATFYTRTTGASIRGSYNIIDVATARILKSESFRGDSEFRAEWATYSGDKRALSFRSRSYASRKEELAPVEEEMVARAAEKVSESLARSLRDYASW